MPSRIRELIDHLRSDVDKVDESQFKAMFETAAKVLGVWRKHSRIQA
jgi:hypothetical protein